MQQKSFALTNRQWGWLGIESGRRGIGIAELIRRILDGLIEQGEAKIAIPFGIDEAVGQLSCAEANRIDRKANSGASAGSIYGTVLDEGLGWAPTGVHKGTDPRLGSIDAHYRGRVVR